MGRFSASLCIAGAPAPANAFGASKRRCPRVMALSRSNNAGHLRNNLNIQEKDIRVIAA
jgi:hypothetical protein